MSDRKRRETVRRGFLCLRSRLKNSLYSEAEFGTSFTVLLRTCRRLQPHLALRTRLVNLQPLFLDEAEHYTSLSLLNLRPRTKAIWHEKEKE
jgi:hypothetical protein